MSTAFDLLNKKVDEQEETILTQQATIDRLTEQRDRLLRDLKYLNADIGSIVVRDLIAEIEAGK